jgi:hypothetical protein
MPAHCGYTLGHDHDPTRGIRIDRLIGSANRERVCKVLRGSDLRREIERRIVFERTWSPCSHRFRSDDRQVSCPWRRPAMAGRHTIFGSRRLYGNRARCSGCYSAGSPLVVSEMAQRAGA